MMKDNYALGTYELELLTQEERDYMYSKLRDNVGYINTAISYNNDYVLGNDKLTKDYKIISKIFPNAYKYYDMMVEKHLEYLHRDKIDIMLIHNPRAPWHDLAKRLESDPRFEEVGVSNFDVKLIEEYKQVTGNYPAYNEIEINLNYCDFETVRYCKEHNIKIIAYTILGGKYKAERMVADYGLPFILNYIRNLADIVIIRPDSMSEVNEYYEVINDLVVTECEWEISGINKKSMVPLDYPLPDIQKSYEGIPTYSNAACKQGSHKLNKELSESLTKECPENWEFISEYKVWLRYMIGGDDYIHDILRHDNKLYTILLYDNDKLTKVNKGHVEVRVYE